MKRVWRNGEIVEARDSKEPKLEISEEDSESSSGEMKRVWRDGRIVEVRIHKEPKLEDSEGNEVDFQPNYGKMVKDELIEEKKEGTLREPKPEKIPESQGNFGWNSEQKNHNNFQDQEVKQETKEYPKLSLEEQRKRYDRLEAQTRRKMPAWMVEEKPEKFQEIRDFKEPKMEEIEEEEIVEKQNPSLDFPKWQPNIRSVTDFLLDSSSDDVTDCNLRLGTSVLFDRPGRIGSYRIDCASPLLPPQQRKDENKFSSYFAKNPHPNAMSMQWLAEHFNMPYRSVYKFYAEKRKSCRILCRPGDPCERIKEFFVRENEQRLNSQNVFDGWRKVLSHELEKHWSSGKPFSIGYVHAIMEKTNLSPGYIKSQYVHMLNQRGPPTANPKIDYTPPMDMEDPTIRIPRQAQRQLEDAYLQKKYNSTSTKEWSDEEIKSLAEKLHMHPESVMRWISKRSGAQFGLNTKAQPVRPPQVMLSTQQTQKLDEYFEKNWRPGKFERWNIGKELGLEEVQVKNYFASKRNTLDLKETREAAQKEFEGLDKHKRDVLEMLARKPRKADKEYIEIALRLAIPSETLFNFLEFWKTTITEKQN